MKHESCVVMEVNIKLGFFICLCIVIQKCSADTPIEVQTTGKDKPCTMTLNACKATGLPDGFMPREILPGPKGDRGEPGFGMNGLHGEKGEKGDEGGIGMSGKDGLPGEKGDKGDRGLPGVQGPRGDEGPVGLEGPGGPQGIDGTPGAKGDEGRIGPSGLPGNDGVCTSICSDDKGGSKPLDDKGDPIPSPENIVGTEEHPSDVPCNVQKEGPLTGKIWVHPPDKFEVECKELRTCLLTNLKGSKHIEENAFHSNVNQTKSFWLSNRIDFDLTKFYGITMKQMAWLQQNTTKVTQTLRYHCKNSYVMENAETELILLSANDVIIRPHASDLNPIAYAMLPNATHDCKEGASKLNWFFSDISVRGNTRRLPVIDFHIRDNRKEDQSFFIELVELCFS